MIGVILASGKSTRLRPLTDNTPKSMLMVAGRPMLEHIVKHLRLHGINNIIVTTHYCPGRITDHFGDGSRFGVKIRYAHEAELVDTAGALKRLETLLTEDFLVVGGNDLLPTLDLQDFCQFHIERGGIGSIAFKRLDDPEFLKLFGQGKLDSDQRLTAFQEKPEQSLSCLVHTTYQCYSPRVLEFIPAHAHYSIPRDLIPRLLAADERVYGYLAESEFVCISTMTLYRRAKELMAHAETGGQRNPGEQDNEH